MTDDAPDSRLPLSRREVVATGLAAAAGFGLGRNVAATPPPAPAAAAPPPAPEAAPGVPYNPRTHLAMPTRNLGRTGYQVGLLPGGGQATIEANRKSRVIASSARRAD